MPARPATENVLLPSYLLWDKRLNVIVDTNEQCCASSRVVGNARTAISQ
ncbi:hypothetical protein [Scytonema sp. PCC 10023]